MFAAIQEVLHFAYLEAALREATLDYMGFDHGAVDEDEALEDIRRHVNHKVEYCSILDMITFSDGRMAARFHDSGTIHESFSTSAHVKQAWMRKLGVKHT